VSDELRFGFLENTEYPNNSFRLEIYGVTIIFSCAAAGFIFRKLVLV
jgi:hypothetical protein